MKNEFNINEYIENTCSYIKSNFCNEEVLVLVSGGVDSTVSAILLKNSNINIRLLLIDTGFMRFGEIAKIKNTFKKLGLKITLLNEKQNFYSHVKNISNPIKKRGIFRKVYFESIIKYMKNNNIKYIAQGTQLHDSKAKIYHNCPTNSFSTKGFHVVEPVKHLVKDQIKQISINLGLPEEITNRKPFPGPGLLIRFGGNYTIKKLNLIRKATDIVDGIVEKYKENFAKCYQIFPYLCDASLVTFVDKNNQGGLGYILLVRAIEQLTVNNSLRYDEFRLPQNIKDEIISELMRINGVARVCFDSTPKNNIGSLMEHGATIEYI